jgi:hypothetical protein
MFVTSDESSHQEKLIAGCTYIGQETEHTQFALKNCRFLLKEHKIQRRGEKDYLLLVMLFPCYPRCATT